MTRRCTVVPLLWALLAALLPLAAVAQERRLGTAVVRGQKIGQSVQTLDSAVVQESVSANLGELLKENSSLFIKSYNRAALTTLSIRGTAPTHTAVQWNGLNLANPMLGSVDFSTIPAFVSDRVNITRGPSATSSQGALGGAIQLSSHVAGAPKAVVAYGSYNTCDAYATVPINVGDGYRSSVALLYGASDNNYHFVNKDKKILQNGRRVYPTELNRHGAFTDLHALYNNQFRLGPVRMDGAFWLARLRRDLPALTVDYAGTDFDNRQVEQDFRGSLSARLGRHTLTFGGTYTDLNYMYARDLGNGLRPRMIDSDSYATTLQANYSGFFQLGRVLMELGGNWQYARAVSHDRSVTTVSGGSAVVGYDKYRSQESVFLKPSVALGPVAASTLLKLEAYGPHARFIPAAFAEYKPWRGVVLKASASYNYHFPSLNELYFLPGGNTNLRPERGWSYDLGAQWQRTWRKRCSLDASLSWYQGFYTDWIMWLPTVKGFYTPQNLKDVNTRGLELKLSPNLALGAWRVGVDLNGAWVSSRNVRSFSLDDASVGRQLPYTPRVSLSAAVRAKWRQWSARYSFVHYSRRHTMTSNEEFYSDQLPPYYMSDLSVGRTFRWGRTKLTLTGQIHNLLDERYVEVLSRPMPGCNYGLSLTVNW